MSDTTMETPKPTAPVMNNKVNPDAVSDETSVITAGTVLTGDIASDGSFDIQGTINGNVTCNGRECYIICITRRRLARSLTW